jgi:hypothetical protein
MAPENGFLPGKKMAVREGFEPSKRPIRVEPQWLALVSKKLEMNG